MYRRLQAFWGIFILLLSLMKPMQVQAEPVNLQQEISSLRAQVGAHPDDIKIRMHLAAKLVDALDFAGAILLYEEVLKSHPQNLVATIELCTLYTMVRQRDNAIHNCETWVKRDAKNYNAHDNLGLSHFKFGEPLSALKPFTQALSLQPRSALVENHLGLTFLALGEFTQARDLFQQSAVRSDLQNEEKALLYHGLYLAYNGLRQPEEALAAIRKTYELSGNPLYFGKVVAAFLRAHQVIFFVVVCFLVLWACSYFGKRLNRFLKNEE